MIEFTFSLVTPTDADADSAPALSDTPIVAPAIVESNTLIRPFRRNGHGGFVSAGFVETVRAAVGQILGTELGSFTANPAFGSRLYLLRQRPQSDEIGAKLGTAYVIEALNRWEPRVRVRNVTVDDRYVATVGAIVRTVRTVYDVVLPGSRSVVSARAMTETLL